MFEQVRKLIIICDEDEKEYARFLMSLISLTDDKDGEVIGIRDGSVSAAIYTPQQYLDNELTISSNQHILYMGQLKDFKKGIPYIPVKFEKYGMSYGWLGRTAFLKVDKKYLKEKEYKEFVEYCESYKEQVAIEAVNFPGKQGAQAAAGAIAGGAAMAAVGGILGPLGLAAVGIAGAAIPAGIAVGTKTKVTDKMVKEQQYHVLSAIFYMEGLKKYMEG